METQTTKHTPGPWYWWKGMLRTSHRKQERGNGEPVLLSDPANASLVAASPELLEAIRLRHEYEALPTDRGGSSGPKGQARLKWLKAEAAAIAKATGEAS